MFHTCISASTADSPRASRTSEDLVYRTREGESGMLAKLGAQCAEFELRQLDVVRKELDADYETSIATKLPPPSRLST